jgi:hypothetical protein
MSVKTAKLRQRFKPGTPGTRLGRFKYPTAVQSVVVVAAIIVINTKLEVKSDDKI